MRPIVLVHGLPDPSDTWELTSRLSCLSEDIISFTKFSHPLKWLCRCNWGDQSWRDPTDYKTAPCR
jgi:hypothetical protein